MFALVKGIRTGGNYSPRANAVLRLLTVLALVAALALVGSAIAEYRVLHAVTRLPGAGYERVLSLECPDYPVRAEGSAVMPTPPETAGSLAKPRLAGFWCAIPLTPD